MKTKDRKTVVVSLDLSTHASALKLAGIYRYLRGEPRWDITLLSGKGGLTDGLAQRHLNRSDGFILMTYPTSSAVTRLAAARKPTVTIDFSYPALSAVGGLIRIDPKEIVKAATAHFDSWGRFATYAYVHDTATSLWSKARTHAAAQMFARNGRTFTHLESRKLRPDDIKRLPKPVAILAANDSTALHLVNLCARYGINIPEDVAVLGIDNDERYVLGAHPAISSIEPEFEREGFEAARMLDTLMSRKPSKGRRIVRCGVNAVFQRGSTGNRPPGDALSERAANYIRANLSQIKSPEEIAAALGVSRRLLDLRLHELHRPTLAEQIRTIRLERLASLLKSTQLPVTYLARQVGFENLSWAMTVFRNRYGMTMKAFRSGA